MATVALVFSNKAVRQYLGDRLTSGHLGGQNRRAPKTDLVNACIALCAANIPYCTIVAGDEWIADDLLAADLSGYRYLVRFEPSYLTDAQEDKLATTGDRLLSFESVAALVETAAGDINFGDAENITVLPRYLPDAPNAPVICHLLNNTYDAKNDEFTKLGDVELTLSESLFGRRLSSATLYAYDREPSAVASSQAANGNLLSIPELGMWGILKLT